jgi:L-rhamnose-H+ transport protein
LVLSPYKILQPEGRLILAGVAIEAVGIGLCGRAGYLREQVSNHEARSGGMVGRTRPFGVAVMLAVGSGVLSAVFNVGFALAQPIAQAGRSAGLSDFSSTNLIWWIMLVPGSISNLAFCAYLFRREGSFRKFRLAGSSRLYSLSALMGLLWGGSIFVYGAAAQRLGPLGTAIGWPLSLATGLLLANAIGLSIGEWKHVSPQVRTWLYSGILLLIAAIVILGNSGA